jgi:RNA polymerase sigma-70 factor (ECF subfamily)
MVEHSTDDPSEDVEAKLVADALAGDSVALDQLLLRYYDRALNYISGRMSEAQHRAFEPADVLQATYMKAYRNIAAFKPQNRHSFFAWIKQIADHQLYDESRKMTRRANAGLAAQKAGNSSYFDMMAAVPGDNPTATALFKRKELEGAFHLAMAKLDPRYQEAIRLRYLEELPMDEVAHLLDVTEDALRGILHRARKKLIGELNRLSHYV